MAGVKTAARLMGRNIRSSIAYAKQEITTGPSGTTYGSLLTYRLGDAAAKWHLEPEQDHTIAPPRDERYAAHQAKELEAWFADGGRDMSFRFSIQVAARAGTPGPIRTVEDGELRWDDRLNPVFPVGGLHFPATGLEQTISYFGPPSEWPNLLRFNIGNTLDEHMPLGPEQPVENAVVRGTLERPAGAPPRIRDTDDELAVRLIRRLRAVRHRADHDSIVLCGSEGP